MLQTRHKLPMCSHYIRGLTRALSTRREPEITGSCIHHNDPLSIGQDKHFDKAFILCTWVFICIPVVPKHNGKSFRRPSFLVAGSRLITRAETKDVDFDSLLSGLADKVCICRFVELSRIHLPHELQDV